MKTIVRFSLLASFVLVIASLLILAGCGGGSVGGTQPPPPTLSSIAVTPASVSVVAGGSQQYKAVGTYSDGSSKDLSSTASWTSSTQATATIGAGGVAQAVAAGTTNITASQGGITSNSASLTVTARSNCNNVITIASVSPVSYYFDDNGTGITSFTLNGSCFAAGQRIHIDGYSDATLPSGVSATQIVEVIPIASPGYMPRFIKISLTSADGTVNSNTVAIAFVGNQNTLALDAVGNLYQLDQGQMLGGGKDGYVRKFKADGTANGSCFVGENRAAIAFDDVDQWILTPGMIKPDCTNVGSGNDGEVPMGFAAMKGMFFVAEPAASQVASFLISQASSGNPTYTHSAAGQQPWSVAMATVGSELDGVTIDREGVAGPQLLKYRISDMTQQGALTVNECTPNSQLPYATGGWQLVGFSTGPAAGKGALLCQADKVLILFDLATMAKTGSVTLTGLPFRIAADVTNGNVIVANADVSAILTRFAKVNALATGTITSVPLAATTPLLSVGLAVSADGTKIDACMQAQCSVLDNN